jgi:hypothetical protein
MASILRAHKDNTVPARTTPRPESIRKTDITDQM